jgi:hypothetical protein
MQLNTSTLYALLGTVIYTEHNYVVVTIAETNVYLATFELKAEAIDFAEMQMKVMGVKFISVHVYEHRPDASDVVEHLDVWTPVRHITNL